MRAAALSLLASVALILGSAVSVYADANPANHGHHYGQIKHRGAPPPPPPPPPPPATPPTTANPPATTTQPATGTQPAARGAGANSSAAALNPAAGGIASVVTPPLNVQPASPKTGEANIGSALPKGDENLWWLLLILAITLAVLWLFAAIQLGRTALKRRTAQAAA